MRLSGGLQDVGLQRKQDAEVAKPDNDGMSGMLGLLYLYRPSGRARGSVFGFYKLCFYLGDVFIHQLFHDG